MYCLRDKFGRMDTKFPSITDTTHQLVKRFHGYQLFEKINQPLSLQHHSAAMLHNHTEVMIEIQHGRQLVFVVDAAFLYDDVKEPIKVHVIDLAGH